MECDSLDKVYYDGTIEDWCNIILSNEDSNPMTYVNHFYIKNSNNEYEELIEIEIPNTITKIGNFQFCGFNDITDEAIINPDFDNLCDEFIKELHKFEDFENIKEDIINKINCSLENNK